jgi:hypothetical protein
LKGRFWSGFATILLALALSPSSLDAQIAGRPDPPSDPVEDEEPPFSPRGAFFRSLALPGWGQAYVGSPGRGAVYFSLAGGSVWMSYVSRRQLLDARRARGWLIATGQIEAGEDTDFAIARARHFEDWAALSIFLFFLAGADAYVAAYLADFDERIEVRPGPDRSLRFDFRIPIGVPR